MRYAAFVLCAIGLCFVSTSTAQPPPPALPVITITSPQTYMRFAGSINVYGACSNPLPESASVVVSLKNAQGATIGGPVYATVTNGTWTASVPTPSVGLTNCELEAYISGTAAEFSLPNVSVVPGVRIAYPQRDQFGAIPQVTTNQFIDLFAEWSDQPAGALAVQIEVVQLGGNPNYHVSTLDNDLSVDPFANGDWFPPFVCGTAGTYRIDLWIFDVNGNSVCVDWVYVEAIDS